MASLGKRTIIGLHICWLVFERRWIRQSIAVGKPNDIKKPTNIKGLAKMVLPGHSCR
jgi:hypothetical protein